MTTDILIIDFDADVHAQMRDFCAVSEKVRIVGEVDSGSKGLQAADSLQPDLLYVASRLPDTTGFDLLRALSRRHRRRSILLTNDMQEGPTAIAAGAIGFLVKPLTQEAFGASILGARERLTPRSATMRGVMRLVAPAVMFNDAQISRPMFLVGERNHRLYPLDPVQIDFVESDGNYVEYHLAQLTYIARESIKRLDLMLAPAGFIRIERSTLVNIRAIAYVQPTGHGMFTFTLASGKRLHSGWAYRDAILSALPLRRRVPNRDKLVGTAEKTA